MKIAYRKSELGKIAALTLLGMGLASLAIVAINSPASAQTGTVTKTVTLGTNGVVLAPENFWTTNAAGITNAVGANYATAAQGATADTALQPGIAAQYSAGVEPFCLRTSHGSGGQNYLFAAISGDGKTFQPMSDAWPPTYTEYVRDASVIRYGDKWVVVYTNAFSGTGSFGLATSTDLITWTKVGDINIGGVSGPANNTWAPEWVLDGGNYYVVVRYSQTGGSYTVSPFYSTPGVGYMQCTNPGTWTTWTNWTALGGIPTSWNDSYIVQIGSTYRIFGLTDAVGQNIMTATSTTPFSGYSTPTVIPEAAGWRAAISASYLEGPCAVHIGGTRWRLYFQKGDTDICYYVESADDMATWTTTPIQLAGSGPGTIGLGHGTVLPITKNDYATAALQIDRARVSSTQQRTAKTFLAGPTSGNATASTFRALVAGDLPTNGARDNLTGGNGTLDLSLYTLTLPALSGNLTVNGNTTLGDASGDALTINAGTVTAPNASSVNATNVANVGTLDARYINPLQSLLAVQTRQLIINVGATENLGFNAPVYGANGIRFMGTSTAIGDYSGAISTGFFTGVGSGNAMDFNSRFALEFNYSQGTNSGNTTFTVFMGTNDRQNLTARGIGLKIACGTGQFVAQVHDGTTLTNSATIGANVGSLFTYRFLLVWDGVQTLSVYYGRSDRSTALTLAGTVATAAPVTGEISVGVLRFGYWATGPSGAGQDAVLNSARLHQY